MPMAAMPGVVAMAMTVMMMVAMTMMVEEEYAADDERHPPPSMRLRHTRIGLPGHRQECAWRRERGSTGRTGAAQTQCQS
jgi:hypothetical protein